MMNWKILALLPALTLATAMPAYCKTTSKNQNTASAVQVAQSNQPNSGAMQKPNAAPKPNVAPKPNIVKKSNPVASHSNVLTIGSRGEAVKSVQNLLKQQGFYNNAVNGVFDNQTRLAVIKFQKSKGLRADGIIGHRTLAALK